MVHEFDRDISQLRECRPELQREIHAAVVVLSHAVGGNKWIEDEDVDVVVFYFTLQRREKLLVDLQPTFLAIIPYRDELGIPA